MSLRVFYPCLELGPLQTALRRELSAGIELRIGQEAPPSGTQVLVEGRPTAELLQSLPDLTSVIIPWSGVPPQTHVTTRAFPHIALHNLHHNAAPVAEHAEALLLTLTRDLIPADRALRKGDWRIRYQPESSPLLAGCKVVILGAGAIGFRIASACKGLSMKTHLVGRRPRPEVQGIDQLDSLLADAQVLFVALPETPATVGLLDARRLGLLPQGVRLVNVGRAAVIDEAALHEGLRSGRIAGAGLDVWYRYPKTEAYREQTVPSAFPFHKLTNVVMSPHRAGHSQAAPETRAFHLAELLGQAARGEQMESRVDLEHGY